MSRTYEFICDDCKQRIWAGQGYKVTNVRLYQHQYIADFLQSHQGHIIRFMDSEEVPDNYKDATPDEQRD